MFLEEVGDAVELYTGAHNEGIHAIVAVAQNGVKSAFGKYGALYNRITQ